MNPLNERINQVFAETGLKKTEIAAKLGVSQPFISQLCSGASLPSERTVSDICRIFRVSRSWLKTGEGEMFEESDPGEDLAQFFGEVLRSAPDERSAFVAALDSLPPEFWPMVAELAREFVRELKDKEKDEGGD